jgi:hypothetical protein
MSMNSTLRCPASTMYSTAEATSLDIAGPDVAGLSIDMLRLSSACDPLKTARVRRTLI